MKKIEFGYSNWENPAGTSEGYGIDVEGVHIYNAEYYGAIKLEDESRMFAYGTPDYDTFGYESYIIAKVTEDEYGHYPNLLGKFIVRPAVAKISTDDQGIMFLDQEQSLKGQQIQNFLNSDQVRDKIRNIDDIVNRINLIHLIKNGVTKNNEPFDKCFLLDAYSATSIRHEEFEKKRIECAIQEDLQEKRSELQYYPPEEVEELLEIRRESLERTARSLNLLSSDLSEEEKETARAPKKTAEYEETKQEPSDYDYYYTEDHPADYETTVASKKPTEYENSKQKLLEAINQNKITWEDKDYIREELIADKDVVSALDHKYTKQPTNDIESTDMKNTKYSPKTQELLEQTQQILEQAEPSEENSVDLNLEAYTRLEQSINNNPTLSDEQKQVMRDALWNDFDNYVEQNPEQTKAR